MELQKAEDQIQVAERIAGAREIANPTDVYPFVAHPKDLKLTSLREIDEHAEPLYIDLLEKLGAPESFVSYYNRFCNPDSAVFIDIEAGQFKATIDYHEAKPNRCKHLVSYRAKPSQDWMAWTNIDGQNHTQQELAEFIEQHEENFIKPSGLDMLEIAQTFDAKQTVTVRSSKRLSDGRTQFSYVEDQDSSSAGEHGQFEVPNEVELLLQPVENGPAYKVRAKLRTRVTHGRLSIGFVLMRPDKIWRHAIKELIAAMTGGLDGVPSDGEDHHQHLRHIPVLKYPDATNVFLI